ncbi:MAG: lipopolysaccharide assembly protein LapB [Cycloclasticus sp.]|nr:lipopolysaccharide assembly protein LapB [Cycloclasticus sp.]MBQ0789426.1 lipopolysaccharide assembly protein LapB [Cycloclasticus sp.]
MYEISFMLLPVAAASGWYFANRQHKRKQSGSKLEHSGYFKGLNYLLNEQPDKAIDVFVDLLEVDDETIEIHLALGTLFRQRGEVEKSIRLHQNLIARPQLTSTLRADVLHELGLDYMRAGLLDRAETIFLELEKNNEHKLNSCQQLLSIFQQEREWLPAIDYVIKLELIENNRQPQLLSQLHCEAAEEFLAKKDLNKASGYLKKALKIDPHCVRASVITAQIYKKNNDFKRALKTLLAIRDQDIRFVPVFLDLILDCFNSLNQPKQKFNFLADLQTGNDSVFVTRRFIDVLIEQEGKQRALDYLQEKLLQEPKQALLKLYALIKADNESDQDSQFFCQVINKLEDELFSFQCKQCGFSSVDLNWCCPSCKQWGVNEPVAV